MTKHSRREREKRAEQNVRIREIGEAWQRSIPPAEAEAFALGVEAARARGPEPRPVDMAPGTAPRPPRPGHEPRPPKEEKRRAR